MTGEDEVTSRFLYQDHFTFYPQGKILLATNHKPVVRETKQAIWDRIRLILFPVTFSEDQRVKGLAHRLTKELPGILNWAIEGCLVWRRDGLATPDVNSVCRRSNTHSGRRRGDLHLPLSPAGVPSPRHR